MDRGTSSLSRLWAASDRREDVLKKHPELRTLERAVARAIVESINNPVAARELEAARKARDNYLKRHSVPSNYAEPQWECAHCRDEGFVAGKPCQCRQRRELERRFSGSRLPEMLRGQTFSTFSLNWYSSRRMTPGGMSERKRAEYALGSCQTFVAEVLEGRKAKGLFISGEVGLGKTFLLSAICNSLVEAGVPTLYTVFSDLLNDIKRSFSQDDRGLRESVLMDTARDVDVLILDDLGAEQVTDFVQNRLFDIVNYRRNHEKPLVVSSNLSVEQVGELYGSRISSRINEMCDPLALYGQDVRWQKERQH